jgi:zinc protease
MTNPMTTSARTTRRVATAAVAPLAALLLAAPPATASAQGAPIRRETPALVRQAPADTTTASFEVAGVRVIHRRVTANEVVAANLYLLGGTRQLTPDNAGIEALLLDVSQYGTARYSKDELRRRMASLGSAIVIAPDVDWTVFGIRATTAGFDSTWSIFADRLMRPTLDSAEFEQVRSQAATGVRQRRDSPDALVDYLADSLAFAGHPYGLSPLGTERSMERIQLADLRRYQREQMVTSRMLLVVVGNVTRPQIERLVRTTIGQLPRGSYAWTLPAEVPAAPSAYVVEPKSLPTNYILGYFSGPPASSADYEALRVATAVLSGRLFAEIRSRRNLTYAVNAPFVERARAAGGLYVTTVSPDVTLRLMKQEIIDLQQSYVPAAGLERLIQQFITEYFLDNETNADQADMLARAQLYRGDHTRAATFVDELRRVTPEDIQRVARQYMRNIRFAYVGDPAKVSAETITRF